MARRSYIRRAKLAPLDRCMSQLQSAVADLRNRVVHRERLELTKQELLDLLVPKEHHDALVTVSGLVRRAHYSETEYMLRWHGTAAHVRFYCSELLAIELHDSVPYDPSSDVAMRVSAWLARRLELGREFGRVSWLVRRLNEHCGTLGHVRYYWPSILTLCSAHYQLNELAERLGTASGVNAPPLPTDVRAACALTAGTVTGAALLNDEVIPDNREVRVDLVQTAGATIHDDQLGVPVPLL